MALSATVTNTIFDDVMENLMFSGDVTVVSTLPYRRNIYVDVKPATSSFQHDLQWVAPTDLRLQRIRFSKTVLFVATAIVYAR